MNQELDDVDEFEEIKWGNLYAGGHIRILPPVDYQMSNFFWWGHPGQGKTVPVGSDFFQHLTLERLQRDRERLPQMFRFQEEALRAFGVKGPLSEALRGLGEARKGRPVKRETPLLKNPPRTTPETVKYLLSRQHSTRAI